MANSADPDQLASSEANCSGSTLFAKKDISGFIPCGSVHVHAIIHSIALSHHTCEKTMV